MTIGSISRRTLIGSAAGLALTHRAMPQAQQGRSQLQGRFDVDRFVSDVRRARAERESQLAVEDVLRRAVSQPHEVLTGVGEPTVAGIHTIHRSPDLTILNVIWAPLMVLMPHNHNMWASIGIYTGREDNMLWNRRGRVVEADGAAALAARDVFSLPSDAIHSVVNPIERLTGAIHIYGGDFFAPGRSEWDPETLEERPWDVEAARGKFRKAAQRFQAVP
jgi:predicted metal-dependent enzyme (double-stranded beta helix superfamily)